MGEGGDVEVFVEESQQLARRGSRVVTCGAAAGTSGGRVRISEDG